MCELLDFLFRMRTHVRPARAGYITEDDGPWVIEQQNAIESFISDARIFGLRVALYNVRELWRLR